MSRIDIDYINMDELISSNEKLPHIFTGGRGNTTTKEQMIEALSNEGVMLISLAYFYAKNFAIFGADITKVWDTATEQHSMLKKAYNKGYADGIEERNDKTT